MKTKREFWVKILAGAVFVIFLVSTLLYANRDNPKNYKSAGDAPIRYVRAKVIEVLEDNTKVDKESEGLKRGSQSIKIKILSGEHKGDTQIIDNYLSLLYNIYAKEGTRLIVRIDTNESGYNASVYNYDRSYLLIGLIALFGGLMGIIGGKKGLKSLLGLAFTIICAMYILIPLVTQGVPVLPLTVLIVVVTTIVCLILLDGINAKTISAMVGTIAGVLIAGALAYIVGRIVHVSGLNMEEAETLLLVATDGGLKIRDLFVAGILISALGAILDTAMNIASAIYELHDVNPTMTSGALLRSGMNIGKDAMGTMANTLILAFAGSSLNLVLLIYTYGIPFIQIFNNDLIAMEIVRAMAASIGIILTVPIVAWVGSRIIIRTK